MKVIIDADVAISTVASRGLCEAVMELCLVHILNAKIVSPRQFWDENINS
jgi:predicted nucleic acid-binding protein